MELSSGRDDISYRLSALREHNWTKRGRRMFQEVKDARNGCVIWAMADLAIFLSWCTCDPMLRRVNGQRKPSMRQITEIIDAYVDYYASKMPPIATKNFQIEMIHFSIIRGACNRTHSAAVARPKEHAAINTLRAFINP